MDLKTFRESEHLTQNEVAQKLKRHVTTISKYETGDTLPSLKVMNQISKLTDGRVKEQDFIRVHNKRMKGGDNGNGKDQTETGGRVNSTSTPTV